MQFSMKIIFAFFCSTLSFASSSAQNFLPRIVNGDPTSRFESVGIVGSLTSGGFCTGTLISTQHVLTAAHCAEFIGGQRNGTFELDGRLFFTRRITIHPNYTARTLQNDVAILELEQPVTNVEPSPLFREEPIVGELLTIVGYGSSGARTDFGELRAGTTPIDDVRTTQVFWDFDNPNESNTAAGDSGGPGFLLVNGEYQVATVTSGGTEADGRFGDTAVNVRVDAYANWIDAVILESALQENEPPEDAPPSIELPNAELPEEPPAKEPDTEIPDASECPPQNESQNDGPSSSGGGSIEASLRGLLRDLFRLIAQWFNLPWLADLSSVAPRTTENEAIRISKSPAKSALRSGSRANRFRSDTSNRRRGQKQRRREFRR